MQRNGDSCLLLLRMQNRAAAVKDRAAAPPKINLTAMRSNNSAPAHVPQKTESRSSPNICMLIALLFKVAKR